MDAKKPLISYDLIKPFLVMALSFLLVTSCHSSQIPKEKISTEPAKTIAECRVVQHVMGETCIPQNPQRPIAISRFTLANALVLGVRPVASTLDYKYPPYLKNRIAGIDQIGEMYQPNLEKILFLKPDLILGWEIARSNYPLLSQISPTVLGKWDNSLSWREHFDFVAEVLGKKEAAQAALKDYYQRIENLKKSLNNRYENQEISVFGFGIGLKIYVEGKSSFAGSILDDLGLKRPKSQNTTTIGDEALSEEKLEEVDGDIIFVLLFEDGTNASKESFEKLQQKPLWKSLKAVKNGRVYTVDSETWIGSNFIAADFVLDDLEKYLMNEGRGQRAEGVRMARVFHLPSKADNSNRDILIQELDDSSTAWRK
jgi:iron complex transport system substrate-binding protein